VLAAISAISSGLFRLYVSNFGNFNQAYGAVGAVIVSVALHERRGSPSAAESVGGYALTSKVY